MVATATATAKPSAMASYRCFKILLLSVAGVFIFGMHRATAERNYATLTARREDIPFIRCRVCEVISKQLVRQVKEKRNKVAPRKVYLPLTIFSWHYDCSMESFSRSDACVFVIYGPLIGYILFF